MKKIMLEKVFASLNNRCRASRRFLLLALKQIDENKTDIVVFEANALVKAGLYSAVGGNVLKGLKKIVAYLAELKVGTTELFFVETKGTRESRLFRANSKYDYKSVARGFSALPASLLTTDTAYASELFCDLLGCIFICAQKHTEDLVNNGRFQIKFRTIQKILGWRDIPAKSIKRGIKNAVSKLNQQGQAVGLLVSARYADGDIEQYLNNSILDVQFVTPLLENYLAAFDLEPALQPESPKLESIEEEVVNAEQINRQDVIMDTLVMLDELKAAVMTHGRIAFDSLVQHALANSATDIETYKQYLEETRKKVADIVTELELCYSEWFGEEIEMGWRDILACKNGGDRESQLPERVEYLGSRYPSSIVWDIIGGFVLRLQHIGFAGKVDALGELGKINCVRFWLKENTMDWTIEELEEIIAGFEKIS